MDEYRIEYFEGEWTVRNIDGCGTYYFGDSCRDCENWVKEHNGEVVEIVRYF